MPVSGGWLFDWPSDVPLEPRTAIPASCVVSPITVFPNHAPVAQPKKQCVATPYKGSIVCGYSELEWNFRFKSNAVPRQSNAVTGNKRSFVMEIYAPIVELLNPRRIAGVGEGAK
jgi:hypothetical protein